MLDSAGLARGALQGVEQVLPDWKEHGKAILAERGLGEEALRMMGMKIPAMERLYQLVYAFSFGFAEMMRGTVSTHRDLLGEMFAAKERELAEQHRAQPPGAPRAVDREEIAWAHEQEHQAQDGGGREAGRAGRVGGEQARATLSTGSLRPRRRGGARARSAEPPWRRQPAARTRAGRAESARQAAGCQGGGRAVEIYLSIYLSICTSIYLSIYRSIYLSVHRIYLYIRYVHIHIHICMYMYVHT